MRIAVIADIHGNIDALEAVLADIAAQGVDETVNLGDHLSGPLEARATAERLMALGLPSIRGNHDRWLVEQDPAGMGISDRVAFDELGPAHLGWLRTLPPTLLVRDEIFLCHAKPSDDCTYWLEEVGPDGSVHRSPREKVEAAAEGLDHPVILCGHTHLPRAVRLGDGRLVVNPGSVGCPGYTDDDPVPHAIEAGTPDASYAIIGKIAGAWSATFRQVPYDSRRMAALAAERGRPDWAEAIATGWIGRR